MNSLLRLFPTCIIMLCFSLNAHAQQNLAAVELDQPAVLKSCDPNWSHREINYCLSKRWESYLNK